ncbi:MAG: hypothetical protein GTO41_21220, partial [Burkholderiales bacterium]|nr:hypothetical protein [Burkholderiales bacterium]
MSARFKLWALLGAVVAIELLIFGAAGGLIYILLEDVADRTRVILYLGAAV